MLDDTAPNLLVNCNDKDPPMISIILTAPWSTRPSPTDITISTDTPSDTVHHGISGRPGQTIVCSGRRHADPPMPRLIELKLLDVRHPTYPGTPSPQCGNPSCGKATGSSLELSSASRERAMRSQGLLANQQDSVLVGFPTENNVGKMFGSTIPLPATGGPARVTERAHEGRLPNTTFLDADTSAKLGQKNHQAFYPLPHSCPIPGGLPARAGTTLHYRLDEPDLSREMSSSCLDSQVLMCGQGSQGIVKETSLGEFLPGGPAPRLPSDGSPSPWRSTKGTNGYCPGTGRMQGRSGFDQGMSTASTFAMLLSLAVGLEKVRNYLSVTLPKHNQVAGHV